MRNRAVVLGGGMAGLVAARVLSEQFEEVLLVDRDQLAGVDEPRRGVPQGGHAHGLLAKGQEVLEGMFPGLTRELADAGIPMGDMGVNLRWYFNGRRLQPAETGLKVISATRPELESAVRDRVRALPNVTFLEHHVILSLTVTADRSRITGVKIAPEGEGAEREITADLVVDATGRGSRTPAWLAEMGYPRPEEERFKIGLSYTTCHYRLRENVLGEDMAILCVATPDNPRGAFFSRLNDRYLLSLTGMLGDQAPTDPEGHLAFVKSLPVPDIYEAVHDATLLDERVAFRYPASVWKHYERLSRFPLGLLVVGDGVCSFNPVYGQGMTVAALEGLTLREHLKHGGLPDARAFFTDVAKVIEAPWGVAAGGDLSYPGVEGERTEQVQMANAYMDRLREAARNDGALTAAFMMVAGLIEPVETLFAPDMMERVAAGAGRNA
ncbi:FAD-binding monooxygenase [Acrocarpospora phusangensis]|uniref:FAD-binding monooxygenase n=1 Tax=Acrocarpospora phusangensis TaxID=1070424 RepID=A0A919UHC0_9ACTN|nr:FAD-dependent oxidoreductase [Acrocarpospora phusangensis]GIH21889.1 FAD-binding monooxygenase [Acrocarpospora phusangensis]